MNKGAFTRPLSGDRTGNAGLPNQRLDEGPRSEQRHLSLAQWMGIALPALAGATSLDLSPTGQLLAVSRLKRVPFLKFRQRFRRRV
jgi:hypothetical protein